MLLLLLLLWLILLNVVRSLDGIGRQELLACPAHIFVARNDVILKPGQVRVEHVAFQRHGHGMMLH